MSFRIKVFYFYIFCGGYSSIGVGIKSGNGNGIISDGCCGRSVVGCGSSSGI